MKRNLRGLFFTIPGIIIGVVGSASCNKVTDAIAGVAGDVCGPCGSIKTGDFSISGDAQLDGFFQAVGTLQNATAKVTGDFNANINALALVYGVTIDANVVDNLIAAIKADISANVQGSLNIAYVPPQCQANLDVGVSAQAQCEVKGGCTATVDPGKASVSCKGSCTGSCSGTCSGDFSCKVQAPSVTCSGQCEGTCEFSAPAKCDGTCHGDCSGNCDVKDAQGKCQGKCDANCTGSCELTAKATCSGKCSGSCYSTPPAAGCDAKAQCNGSCSGSCSGGCTGDFDPPSASGSCDASAKCTAQAKAQANASLQCTPPSLGLTYAFKAGVTADAQAQFMAHLAALKVQGAAILQGAAQMTALINGKVNGKVVFDPAPLASVTASVQGFVTGGFDAFTDVPKARLLCLPAAFQDAADALVSVTSSTTATIAAQGKFAAIFTG